MKVIGITGGVGAGKSSVLALLKEMCSCDIIQADLVARNIYHSGNIGFKKVVDIFGEQIVGEDGEINRPLLADIIFKNPNKRIVLNSIIHPLVKQEIINQINVSQSSIAQAQENLRLQRDYYNAGTCTMSDLLEAQTLLQKSNDKLTDNITQYHIRLLEYNQAFGR